ncbi:VWA domain-containing protein [candidate division KSB1 bacterium]|nr:VWA domain-containing protein [candidate division KSB1 bacterium]
MKKLVTGFVIFVALAISIQHAFALGVLYNRPLNSSQQYSRMWIKSVDISVDIQDQIAVTHVDQIFHNDLSTRVESIYIFPLPENAMITELVYWFNGKRYVAEIRERQEAINDYNNQVRRQIDPALLEYLGDNLFRLSIAPIDGNSDVRTEITYVELLNYEFGRVQYKFLLNTLGLSPKALQTVSLNVNAQSQTPFRLLTSPSHQNSTATHLQKVSDYQYAIMYGDENYFPDKDFTLEFETVRDDVTMNVLTYTPTAQDSFGTDSFYALWITPPDSVTETEAIPKNIMFTADVSSSMEGSRMEQLKSAMHTFLDLLNPQDSFNIATFGTFTTMFETDLVPANEENISAAHDFVYQMYAMGMTNIDAALSQSLNQSFGQYTSNILVFLTDGNPTYGETDINQIIQNSKSYNQNDVRIYTFAIGDNISRSLIINVARENGGYPTFIDNDESIASAVANHFTRISKPIWTNLYIDMAGLYNWDYYPKILSDLFWGNQVNRLGLYSSGGSYNISLSGNYAGQDITLSKSINFDRTAGQGHRFVPRLWAKAKIDHLTELISAYGETTELVNQIIALSLRFQILTEYTALYSDPNVTAVDKNETGVTPEQFTLQQNYPNPFNSTTSIRYTLPSGNDSHHVILKIYDVLGRLVATLVDATQSSGSYAVTWNGTNQIGMAVPSGTYFYMLEVDGVRVTKKMVLLE